MQRDLVTISTVHDKTTKSNGKQQETTMTQSFPRVVTVRRHLPGRFLCGVIQMTAEDGEVTPSGRRAEIHVGP